MAFLPVQEAFNAGELSPRLRGRLSSDVYKRGLSECQNFIPLPQGPLLMRAGSEHVYDEDAAPRLVQFRAAGSAEDYILSIAEGRFRVFSSATGALVNIRKNLITNGHFDVSVLGWTLGGAGLVTWQNGVARIADTGGSTSWLGKIVAVTAGAPYTLRLRARKATANPANLRVTIDGAGTVYGLLSRAWKTYSHPFVPAGANVTITIEELSTINEWIEVDDVSLTRDDTTVTELAAPWTAAQVAAIQYDSEPAQSRMTLVHSAVQPQVIVFTAPSTWEIYSAEFTNQPPEWGEDNWPRAVEVGFQGRTFFGCTPNEPHTVWYSKSGSAFDFTIGVNAGDSGSFIVSTKGTIEWLRGQKALLAGGEVAEHSITGSNRIITPSDVNVEDESAFGSALVQAAHIGDEVIFVGRDRRSIRALSYDAQTKNGWVSRALTFMAEHITKDGVKEIHFARSPDPTLIFLTALGGIVGCTYDRGEEVLAWWRVATKYPVFSAAVADSTNGSELWISVDHPNNVAAIEHIPLHEVGAVYVDSAKIGALAVDGSFAGLAHLNGETVRVIVNGALEEDQVVVAGVIQAVPAERVVDDPTLVGATVVVGLPYTARAVTLPLDLKHAKAHNAKIGVMLNNSAVPKIGNAKSGKLYRPADRTPSTPMDTPEPLFTGKVKVASLGADDEAKIIIEQDRPFRTEILALYSVTEA